jgi:hypothetical protein
VDRFGREISDDEYQTKDFERVIALRARTQAIAHHLTEFRKKTDRFAKTIVFCVDQEHASEMREALGNLNADLRAQYPDYICRVTADEGQIGRGHLSRFQDVETRTPTILTTSQLLTTGVDAPTCKNVVLARIVGSAPSLPPAENELASSLAVAGQAHFAERRIDLACPFACSKSRGAPPVGDSVLVLESLCCDFHLT